jgi:transposase InsO family protein
MKKSAISTLYSTPKAPASFSGLASFHKNHKNLPLKQIKTELEQDPTYTLHKQIKRKFKRRQVQVSGRGEQWQIDLLDVSKLKHQNSHFTFLLTCIDVFSRFAYVVPLKSKEGKSCAEALKLILANSPSAPKFIYSDAGHEFTNKHCKDVYKTHNIIHILTQSTFKAAIVERFNKTLRQKIWRYMTFKKTKRYVDVLQDLVKSYNDTIHSSIGLAPSKVNEHNEAEIKIRLYGDPDEPVFIKFKFKIGDYVRLIIDKKVYEKGATINWSEEIYIIDQLIPSVPPVYKIRDLKGTLFDWNYYANELQAVKYPYDTFEVLETHGKESTVIQLNSSNREPFKIKT